MHQSLRLSGSTGDLEARCQPFAAHAGRSGPDVLGESEADEVPRAAVWQTRYCDHDRVALQLLRVPFASRSKAEALTVKHIYQPQEIRSPQQRREITLSTEEALICPRPVFRLFFTGEVNGGYSRVDGLLCSGWRLRRRLLAGAGSESCTAVSLRYARRYEHFRP
jgi:hypothetical protein